MLYLWYGAPEPHCDVILACEPIPLESLRHSGKPGHEPKAPPAAFQIGPFCAKRKRCPPVSESAPNGSARGYRPWLRVFGRLATAVTGQWTSDPPDRIFMHRRPRAIVPHLLRRHREAGFDCGPRRGDRGGARSASPSWRQPWMGIVWFLTCSRTRCQWPAPSPPGLPRPRSQRPDPVDAGSLLPIFGRARDKRPPGVSRRGIGS
jgi:hypothetical protein